MFPFIADKGSWPFAHDVEYFDQWPVRQPSLFFAGLAYSQPGLHLDFGGNSIPIRRSRKLSAIFRFGSLCFGLATR